MFKRAINKDGKIVRIDDYPTREAAHFEYNATLKQIQRMLRLDQSILQSIFGSQG